jgi:hypothetical protein
MLGSAHPAVAQALGAQAETVQRQKSVATKRPSAARRSVCFVLPRSTGVLQVIVQIRFPVALARSASPKRSDSYQRFPIAQGDSSSPHETGNCCNRTRAALPFAFDRVGPQRPHRSMRGAKSPQPGSAKRDTSASLTQPSRPPGPPGAFAGACRSPQRSRWRRRAQSPPFRVRQFRRTPVCSRPGALR